MKIRQGFVSNSSSASFICRNCEDEYDIESRGGVVDEWEPPMEGLCEKCMTKSFICKCNKIIPITAGIEICSEDNKWNDGYEHMDGNIIMFNNLICPKCLVKETGQKFQKILHEWATKVADPNYKLTAIDKKLAEAIKKGHKCATHTH